jgi:prophage regulatory protein
MQAFFVPAQRIFEGKKMPTETQSPIVLLRCKTVLERTGLKRSSLYKLILNGEFPSPVKITAKAVAWPSNEINAWVVNRIQVSKSDTREGGAS